MEKPSSEAVQECLRWLLSKESAKFKRRGEGAAVLPGVGEGEGERDPEGVFQR